MKKIGFLLLTLTLLLIPSAAYSANTVKVKIGTELEVEEVFSSRLTKVDSIGTSNGLPSWTGYQICGSLLDSKCLDAKIGLLATSILANCESETSSDCIEKPAFKFKDETSKVAEFVDYVDSPFEGALKSSEFPLSKSTSIWAVEDKNGEKSLFSVTVQLKSLFSRNINGKLNNAQLVYFGADVRRVSLQSINPEDCFAVLKGKCVSRLSAPDVRVALNVRLKSANPLWLSGKMRDPEVDLENSNLGKSIELSGNMVTTPIVEGIVPINLFSKYPWGFESIAKGYSDRNQKFVIDPGLSLLLADDIFKELKEKSSGEMSFWNLSGSMPFTAPCSSEIIVECLQGGNGPCIDESKTFAGVLATNALAFSRNPPKLIDNEVQYLLASPHYLSTGKETVGSFDLIVNSDVLRCIYSLPKLPLQVEISVTNSDGEKKVAVNSFTERGNKAAIRVSGFGFSSPTIRMKFSPTKKNVTINCLMGKTKKSISGVKPACPKGYKKVI